MEILQRILQCAGDSIRPIGRLVGAIFSYLFASIGAQLVRPDATQS
jgi:hypothetical protein